MNQPIITVENLSKCYTIGTLQQRNYATFRDDLVHFLSKVFHYMTHYEPRRPKKLATTAASENKLWALKNIQFSVNQGEVVGIIGRNGAGKSTLLKILSRITDPTQGEVKIHGRLASLLEVGTGFHPELTGRENIFLNAAILGMRRAEIKRKFDEIVSFAEISRMLDTPVKRYSSGMYVRLAFSVAAHLDPDVLVIDEVLSVGDVAFQKKCTGIMQDVARSERTVLFVTHNLQLVRSLCTRAILIDSGNVVMDGPTESVLSHYLKLLQQPRDISNDNLNDRIQRTRSGAARFSTCRAIGPDGKERWEFQSGETIRFRFQCKTFEDVSSLGLFFSFISPLTQDVITTYKCALSDVPLKAGTVIEKELVFPNNSLRPGDYSLYVCLGDREIDKIFDVIDANISLPLISISSNETDIYLRQGYFNMPAELRG